MLYHRGLCSRRAAGPRKKKKKENQKLKPEMGKKCPVHMLPAEQYPCPDLWANTSPKLFRVAGSPLPSENNTPWNMFTI